MLTRPQAGAIAKIENILANGAKPHDFRGVRVELAGGETGFDHVTEMRNNLRGLSLALASLRGSLANPNLPIETREALEDALHKGQRVEDNMRAALRGGE